MAPLILLLPLLMTASAVPVRETSENDVEYGNLPSPAAPEVSVAVLEAKDSHSKQTSTIDGNSADLANSESPALPGVPEASKKGRKQKAFTKYPIEASYKPSIPPSFYGQNYYGYHQDGQEQEANRKKYQDSKIYYVQLPAVPYSYVPGLGYVSQPPKFSTDSLLRPTKPNKRPQNSYPSETAVVHVPVEFVSNGKPTSVYWPPGKGHTGKGDSPVIRLNKGPYVFNGRPTGIYVIGAESSPPAQRPSGYRNYY